MTVDEVVGRLRGAGCVFAEEEAALLLAEADSPSELEALVERRVAGEPLEYVVGWAEFCGLRIVLEPGVFVPRRRSELLVHEAVSLLEPGDVVVDLCCGSGALGAAILAEAPNVELHAADLDPVAVRCARRNLPAASVHDGDLFEALPVELRGSIDVLVANVPYVPTHEIALLPAEAHEHEPRVALDGGPDGLAVVGRVATTSPQWLRAGGHVLVETTAEQAETAERAFTAAGSRSRVVHGQDLAASVVVATLPAAAG